MERADAVTVEFYGIPRLRAGRAELVMPSGTVAEMLAAVQRACPGLGDLLDDGDRVAPHYLLSINGRKFLADPRQRLAPGDRLLVLSADAGG